MQHALDAIIATGTTATLAKVLERAGKGGVISTVLPSEYDDAEKAKKLLPETVKVETTSAGEAWESASTLCSELLRQMAKWIGQGKFKPLNVRMVEDGLKGVPEGLKLLEEGKVSAAKLICELRPSIESRERLLGS